MIALRNFFARLFHRTAKRLDPTIVEPLGNRTWLRMELDALNEPLERGDNIYGLTEFPFGRFTALTKKWK